MSELTPDARAVLDAAVAWYADFRFDHSVGGLECRCKACLLQKAPRAYEAAKANRKTALESLREKARNGDEGGS
jgi:hypothetical protein